MNTAWIRKRFPDLQPGQWADWRWQLKNRLRDADGLCAVFDLTPDEMQAVQRVGGRLPLGITPYYANLFAEERPDHPLRKTMIPRLAELEAAPWEMDDPLGEEGHSPLPGLVHTYPDKILFLVTDFCATYCRYCTRARMVGSGEFLPDRGQWERSLEYIREHSEIRDVLLSGGDPLVLADDRLEWLLSRISKIPHVEIIRIGTKIPAVLPQRVTPELTAMLRKYHPLWLSIHFTHALELTPEVEQACSRLADAGIPLMSQTVLLAGVNDDPEAMRKLNQKLLTYRVKPYYLHQCDAITGSAHFKTPVSRGLEIIQSLHGWTTGYAVPHYMIDAPGGGGKIAVHPEGVLGQDNGELRLMNFRGDTYRYHDPPG